MAGIKVNQKTRTVTVYRLSIEEFEYKIVDTYRNSGYFIKILEEKAPKRPAPICKKDFEYLKGKVSETIYAEIEKKDKNNENFLKIKSWIKQALEAEAKANNTKYVSLENLIREAKKEERAEKKRESENKTTETTNSEKENKQKIVKLN